MVWSWSHALLGLAYAIPSIVVTIGDPSRGLGLAVGVLCAAALGLRPVRRQRGLAVVAGVLAGAGIFLGSCVAPWPVVAVSTLFVAAVGVAVTAPRYRLGPLVLMLTLPLFAAGLSEPGPSDGIAIALLMVTGSVYAWLVSLCWPGQPAPEAAPVRCPAPGANGSQPRSALVDYGVRLGLTGSLSAAAGYALGFDHPGWAAAAALLVSRPTPDLTRTRAFGRAGAVVTGAAVALSVTAATPPNAVVAVLTAAALIGAAATTGSRWYITGGFTTFVVLTLMDLQTPSQSQWWFLERVAATLIGVTFAWVMMIVLPARAGGTAHGADLG